MIVLIVFTLRSVNAILQAEGKKVATAKPMLMGITLASWALKVLFLQHHSKKQQEFYLKRQFLDQVDYLYGLKENVIIGKLIPAGTGIRSFRKKYLGMMNLNWNEG